MIPALALWLAAPTSSRLELSVERLRCGAADFQLTSRHSTTRSLAPASQTLSHRVGTGQRLVGLEPVHGVTVDGRRVGDRYVASWACVAGNRGRHYVLLGYACAIDSGLPHDCAGEKEWFRLLDERGRFADAGVPHDGSARDGLNARLGIRAPWRRA